MADERLEFYPPPVSISSTNTLVSNITKLVNLEDGDYAIDNGVYKRLWYVTFQMYNDVSYTYRVIDGHTSSIPSKIREGYTFLYWMHGENTWEENTIVNGNIVLTAVWEIMRCNITFNANGGTSISDTILTYGSLLYEPVTTRQNNTFDGWYYTSDYGGHQAGERIIFPVTIVGHLNIKAEWNVTVTFISEGVTYSSSTIRSGTTVSQPTNPAKPGYNFVSWMINDSAFNFSNVVNEDITLVASFEMATYTISYTMNGATQPSYTTYRIDSATFTIPAVSKTGYTFNGWSGTNITGMVNSITIVNGSYGNLEFTANFTPIVYNITYDANGGSISNQKTTYTIEESFNLVSASKTGYTFNGWNWNGNIISSISAGTYGDISLTADYTIITYTITYNLNNGTNNVSNVASYTIESNDITIYAATRTGYTFNGWTGTELSSATNSFTISSGSIGDRIYTANWTVITYNITYTLNNGTNNVNNIASYTVENTPFTIYAATRTGYTFNGWTGTELSSATNSFTVAKDSIGDRSYTANWTPIPYTITYNTNGGSISNQKTTYTIEESFNLVSASKTGYTFNGWNLNGNVVTSISAGTYGDISLTANYTVITYTITYNLNDGTNNSNNRTSYNIETNTFTIYAATRTGYSFNGWTGTDVLSPTTTFNIAKGSIGNREFTANWTPIVYNITYDANGGSISNQKTTYTIEESFNLVSASKTGYTFNGWNWNGNIISSISAGTYGDISLTADYTPITYNITYDANGGSISNQKTTYTIEESFNLVSASKTGYTFNGWNRNGNVITSISAGTYGDISLTADYTVITYTISYTMNGATQPSYTSYTIESNSFTIQAVSKTGYTFNGWSGTGISGKVNTITISKGSTGDRSYTANFTIITYTITYNLNNGTNNSNNKTSYTVETATFTVYAATRTGYTFNGWSGTGLSSNTASFNITKGSTGDRTYTANWTLITYTISYTMNGATQPSYTSYTIESNSFTIPAVSKTGYTFNGWSGTGISSNTNTITISKGSTGNRSYTANFTIITYNITYDANGGSISGQKTTYTIETATFTLVTASKTGYTYNGWTKQNSSTVITSIAKGTYGDLTLTANYTPITYNISYDANGGSISGQKTTYTIETATFTLVTASKTGYTYNGWTKQNSSTVITSITKGTYGDLALTANYTIITYTISYTMNNATQPSYTSYTIESSDFTIPAVSKTGYTFNGWSGTSISGKVNTITITKGSTGNRSYTANFTPITYNITYTMNGATQPSYTSYTIESAAFTIPAVSKTGYTFNGWSGTGISGKVNTITISKGSTGDRSYTANFTIITYTISYTLNNGTNNSSNKTSYNVTTSTFTVYAATRTGYTFNGWTGTGLSSATTSFNITKGSTGNRTYTANWTPITYNITYDANGGSISGQKTTYTIEDETFTLVSASKDYYTYNGWTKQNSSTVITSITKGTYGDLTLTANYTPITYTISYTLNSGTNNSNNKTSYTVETATFTVYAATRTGYTFNGWSGTGLSSNTTSFSITKGSHGDRSYTANWTIITYTITYNLNNGTNNSSNKTSYNVTTATFTVYAATRTGYTFNGWTGTGLSSATTSFNITKGSTGNRTYTANWTPITYNITYDANGGSISGQKTTYTIETATFTLVTASKTGYTYNGWTKQNSSTVITSIAKGTYGDLTLTANYTPITYNITYTMNGATQPSYTSYTIESAAFTIPAVSKTGYTFNGWSGTNISGKVNTITISSGSTGDRSYTANFTVITYTISYTLNSGTNNSNNKTSYTVETATFTVYAATRTGYTFNGWTGTGLSSATTSFNITKGSTGNRSYTANWTPTTYTISYTLNSGTNNSNNKTSYTIETATFTVYAATRTGYTFNGWTGTGLSSATTSFNVTKGSYGNRSYTANWTPITYTISYTLNSGTNDSDNKTSYTIETATFTIKAATRSGYYFDGWTGTGLSSATTSFNVTKGSYGNRSYTANWTILRTVTYVVDGSTWTTQSVRNGNTTSSPGSPSKTGYSFVHWYQSNSSTAFNFSTTITSNITLTARFDIITYTITYNLDGGTASNPTSYTVETSTFTLNNPTKDGVWTFLGWTGSNGSSYNENVTISKGSTGDRTYTAYWYEGYTISLYDPDGVRQCYYFVPKDMTIGNCGNYNDDVFNKIKKCLKPIDRDNYMLKWYDENGNNINLYLCNSTGGTYYSPLNSLYNANRKFYSRWVECWDVYFYIFGTLYDVNKYEKTSNTYTHKFNWNPSLTIELIRKYISNGSSYWDYLNGTGWYYRTSSNSSYTSHCDSGHQLSNISYNLWITASAHFSNIPTSIVLGYQGSNSIYSAGISVYISPTRGRAFHTTNSSTFVGGIRSITLYYKADSYSSGTIYLYKGSTDDEAKSHANSQSSDYLVSAASVNGTDSSTTLSVSDDSMAWCADMISANLRFYKIEASGFRWI